MRIKFKINKSQAQKSIASLLKKRASAIFKGKLGKVRPAVVSLMAKYINAQPEISSLRGGELKTQFGLTSAEADAAADAIVNLFSQSVTVPNPKLGALVGGTVSIVFISPSYESFYQQVPNATRVSSGGFVIPWLKWLLEEAQTVRIANYRIMYKPDGRSSQGFMIKHKGRYWSIPAPFDRPENDNIVNRILKSSAFRSDLNTVVAKVLR